MPIIQNARALKTYYTLPQMLSSQIAGDSSQLDKNKPAAQNASTRVEVNF